MSNAPQASEVGHDYMPSIFCVNKSTVPLGVDWAQLLAALDKYVNTIFAPVWRTPAKIVDGGTNTVIPPGRWGLVFLDDTDRQNNLGYHDLTPDGLPLGKVFIRDVLKYGGKVSVTASHELGEMLVDPGIHMGARGPDENSWYAYETSDAVESIEFLVDGIAISNFVYPAWFEPFREPGSTHFDYLKTCNKPFEIYPDGFMLVFQDGKWTQKGSSDAAESRLLDHQDGKWIQKPGAMEAKACFNEVTHPRMTARPKPTRRLSNHDHLPPGE